MGKREQPAFRCALHVLKDVNLEVAEGEKLVIIGPSGSGKSTTVRCMNFLEEPTSGHVYIDGQELTVKNKTKLVRETTSMVFQQFNLYPHMTVLKNLTLAPMKLHHKTKQEAEELAYHYLEVVGLRDKANVYPAQLSGGQQQRIAIARALCAQTKIILFDEPTSALDPETIQEVLDVMVRLAHEKTSPWWWSPTRWALPGRWQTVWCLWQTARSWKKAHRSTSSPIQKTSVCASSWARSSGKQFWSLRSCRSTSGTRCG